MISALWAHVASQLSLKKIKPTGDVTYPAPIDIRTIIHETYFLNKEIMAQVNVTGAHLLVHEESCQTYPIKYNKSMALGDCLMPIRSSDQKTVSGYPGYDSIDLVMKIQFGLSGRVWSHPFVAIFSWFTLTWSDSTF